MSDGPKPGNVHNICEIGVSTPKTTPYRLGDPIQPSPVAPSGRPVCYKCGSDRLMRSGTCSVCTNCGETTGCS
jgi:ribonucleoside-diphosphate reductase alpha chain